MKILVSLVLTVVLAASLGAQNFSMDARRIAMGGVGEKKNGAADLAGDARNYRSIVVPLGLFQILNHLEVFKPNDDRFNPIRAMEYAASPIHYTVNREDPGAEALVSALVNAKLNRDLNTYRGFAPQSSYSASGLTSTPMGPTIRGVFFGVGPYISLGTKANIDQKLIDLLSSSTNVYSPTTTFSIKDTTDAQAAATITGGYRRRVPIPLAGSSERDGLYVSGNYNYLYGLDYETLNLDVRFDTDTAGLVTLLPTTVPISIDRLSSSKGHGFSVDLGSVLVTGPWDVRFSANGIGNRIDWENLHGKRTTLNSLFSGGDFVDSPLPALAGKRRVTLPVQYVSGLGYTLDKWSVAGEVSHGIEQTEFHSGAEYRLGLIELRGGGRYSRELWHPAGGVGLNVLPNFGIDFAAFTVATNIERERRATIALSLRLGGGN